MDLKDHISANVDTVEHDLENAGPQNFKNEPLDHICALANLIKQLYLFKPAESPAVKVPKYHELCSG